VVEVSWRVWEYWREVSAEFTEPTVVLSFTSALSQDDALDAVASAASDAVRELDAALEAAGKADEASAGHWSLAPASGGVLLLIDEEPHDFEGLLRRIASGLEARGVDGAFDLYVPETTLEVPEAVDLLECRLRAAGARYHKRYANYGWDADPAALWTGVETGIRWCRENAPNLPLQLVVRLIPPSTLRPDEDVTGFVRRALGSAREVGVVRLMSATPDRFRTLAVSPSDGRVSLIQGGAAVAGAGWKASLADLRAQVDAAATWAVYGFVRRGSWRSAAELATSLAQDWPPVPHSDPYTLGSAAFEDEFAPDAFGLQLLGPGYAGRLPEGPVWKPVPAGPDAVVLEHADPEAWFSRPFVPFGGRPNTIAPPIPPVPDVLARSRRISPGFSLETTCASRDKPCL
jgi:hypothetical protein